MRWTHEPAANDPLWSAFSIYSLLKLPVPTAEAAKDLSAVQFTPIVPANNMTPPPAVSLADTAAVLTDPWSVVWAVGALVCTAFFAVAYLKCHREFKASLPVDNEYVHIRRFDAVTKLVLTAALCVHWFNPAVLL